MEREGGHDARPADRPDLADVVHDELSHRVANSLQVVGALLARAAKLEGDELRLALADAGQRVDAVSAVHRRLCGGGAPDAGLGLTLAALCGDVSAIYGRSNVALAVGACDLALGPARRNALCLLVAELVGNALKHAFATRGGTISVLVRDVDGEVELVVEDDGCGFEPERGRPADRFGWRIVAGLTASLGGVMQVESRPGVGTSVCIQFLTAQTVRRA